MTERHLLGKKDVEISRDQKWEDEYDSVIEKLFDIQILANSRHVCMGNTYIHPLLPDHEFPYHHHRAVLTKKPAVCNKALAR